VAGGAQSWTSGSTAGDRFRTDVGEARLMTRYVGQRPLRQRLGQLAHNI